MSSLVVIKGASLPFAQFWSHQQQKRSIQELLCSWRITLHTRILAIIILSHLANLVVIARIVLEIKVPFVFLAIAHGWTLALVSIKEMFSAVRIAREIAIPYVITLMVVCPGVASPIPCPVGWEGQISVTLITILCMLFLPFKDLMIEWLWLYKGFLVWQIRHALSPFETKMISHKQSSLCRKLSTVSC